MPTTDPLLQGNVLLDIDGVGVVANFTSVSGVSSEVEIVDNPFVNDQGKITIGKLPGKPKTPTVTLKRGLTGATEIWDWHSAVMQGNAGPPQRLGDPHEHHRRGGPSLQLHERHGVQDQPVRGRRDHQRRPDRGGDPGLRDARQGLGEVTAALLPELGDERIGTNASDALRTEYAFVLPARLRRRVRHRPSRGRHAPRDGPRRDHPPARSPGPRERVVPDDPAAVPGRDPARHAARRSTPGVIEGLFASDLAFLQDLYRRINQEGHTQASVTCPSCNHAFTVDVAGEQRLGES